MRSVADAEHPVGSRSHERFAPGWTGMKNGDLLRAAEMEFEVFVTTDQNLRYQ